MPVVAIVGTLAVLGSLLTAPTPAHAQEASLDVERAAISSSVSRGTYVEDVISGKITVAQVVDVDLATRSTAAASTTTPTPTRAELTRQATEELARIRATGSIESAPELTPASGSRVAHDPLVESKHWWNKVLHWATIQTDAFALSLAGTSFGALAGVILGGCLAYGAFVCAAIAGASAAVLIGLGARAVVCLADKHAYLYIKVPDFTNSHCGD